MDIDPRPDCPACHGSGTIAIDPDRPKTEPCNEGHCVLCWFGTHDICAAHGLCKPCTLCAVATAALAEGCAQELVLVPALIAE